MSAFSGVVALADIDSFCGVSFGDTNVRWSNLPISKTRKPREKLIGTILMKDRFREFGQKMTVYGTPTSHQIYSMKLMYRPKGRPDREKIAKEFADTANVIEKKYGAKSTILGPQGTKRMFSLGNCEILLSFGPTGLVLMVTHKALSALQEKEYKISLGIPIEKRGDGSDVL